MIELDSPETRRVESQLALQLLMDRVLKKMLENKASAVAVNDGEPVAPLTMREQSAIRYMAGYVTFKLLWEAINPSAGAIEMQLFCSSTKRDECCRPARHY